MNTLKKYTPFLFISWLLINLLYAAERPPGGGGPGEYWVHFQYDISVADPDGNPLSNIEVRMTAVYGLMIGGDWQSETVSATGFTNSTGDAHLDIWEEVSNWYPDNYQFSYMWAEVIEPGYTVVADTGTPSNSPTAAASFEIIHDEDGNGIKDEFEVLLAQKFCPTIVLNSGDHGVAPEPVEIMMVDMTNQNNYFYVDLWNFLGEHVPENYFTTNDPNWTILVSHEDNIYFPCGQNLVCENYSNFPGSYYGVLSPPSPLSDGWYRVVFHPDWGGPECDTPSEWYALYDAIGNNFPHTIYPHFFLNGNEVVIQFWMFYPFNAFINRHEGDWEHINVVLDSQNPTTANIIRIEYFFHHYVLSRNPQNEVIFDEGTHPVVFVGGSKTIWFPYWVGHGSHGSYPTYGHWTNVGALSLDEDVNGNGLIIKHTDFQKIIIPNPSAIDYNQRPEMSWLKANIPWGQLLIEDSFGQKWLHSDIPVVGIYVSFVDLVIGLPNDVGNLAPVGPAHNNGWNDVGDSPNGTTFIWYQETPPPLGQWPISQTQ